MKGGFIARSTLRIFAASFEAHVDSLTAKQGGYMVVHQSSQA